MHLVPFFIKNHIYICFVALTFSTAQIILKISLLHKAQINSMGCIF